MNSFSSKLITVLASILLLAYIIVQVATLLYNPYETEIVRNGIYEQDILLEGYFVRNEKSLEEQKNGVISYYFEDGEKVPNNAVIADVFQSEKELLNVKFLQRLDVEKNILENSSLKSGETPKLNVLNKDIRLLFTDLLLEIQSEDFTDLVNINDQLIYKLNRASVCIDSSINFNDSINEINNQITSLAASRSQSSHQVVSNSSGYFASFVDGFEGLSYQNSTVDSILNTIDILKKSSNSKSNSIGKVLSDSEWRFLGIVDASKAEYFKPDKYFKMSLGPKSEPIKVRVEKIIDSSDTGKIGVVLYGDTINSEIVSTRLCNPKILLEKYEGILIPKDAVRFNKVTKTIVNPETEEAEKKQVEVKGVYTLLGKSVKFKEIDIIYEDNYIIISKPNLNTGYVSIYDKVILKGKDLSKF